VEPVAAIVSDSDGRFTSGLVVKNPFLKSSMPSGEKGTVGELQRMVPGSELLFCSLQSWHDADVLMENYEMCSAEGCWIEHYYAIHVVCDWRQ
jgi:hypothetical protein